MRTEPELEALIQEFRNLQVDQARIQARQAAIIDLLEVAVQENQNDPQPAPESQTTQEEQDSPTPRQSSSTTGHKDKYGSAIKVGDKVQILTLGGIRRKDRHGIIVAFTPKRVKVKTGTPPEVVVRADSNLVRVIDV